MTFQEIGSKQDFLQLYQTKKYFLKKVFENIDFTHIDLENCIFKDCIFMGCVIQHIDKEHFINCTIFPTLNVGYNPYLSNLYTRNTLFDNYELGKPESYLQTTDYKIYKTFIDKIEFPKIPQHHQNATYANYEDVLARRMHDNAISDALNNFLSNYDPCKIVAIMGGHNLSRNSHQYKTIAYISKKLTEAGYLMVSGGGPGAMEATHLGAWLADANDIENKKIEHAIQKLSLAPSYKDRLWLDKAFEVLKHYPISTYESVGIPTWFYGHEPPTPFASRIAKYFANSVREDGLLAIANGGIIYTPGSAGTIQEVFQDVAQNHYRSYGIESPMIFYDANYWTIDVPVYPLIQKLRQDKILNNIHLSLHDDPDTIINDIKNFKRTK
jgi:predicted Rossmann-fold nucleotide-binding protein